MLKNVVLLVSLSIECAIKSGLRKYCQSGITFELNCSLEMRYSKYMSIGLKLIRAMDLWCPSIKLKAGSIVGTT